MNVALYPALLCPAWKASPRKGLWGCWHPRKGKSRAAGTSGGAKAGLLAAPSRQQGGLQGPSRAAGRQYGQLLPSACGMG